MADDPTNMLSTPQGYATPQQLAQIREYATKLTDPSKMQPVQSWTQGVSNMVQALMGGWQNSQANQFDRTNQATRAAASMPGLPTQFDKPTGNSRDASEKAPREGASNFAPTGGNFDLAKAADITSGQESGGRYDNVTTTKNPKSGQMQSALGKYGVMDFNVGPWTKEVLGKEMTPQEFLGSPEAQDTVYKSKMGGYLAKYGPEGAGRAWLGGPGGVSNPQRTDALGTSVGDYGNKFALAFNGQPASPATPDAGSAIVQALQNGKPGAPTGAGAPPVSAAGGDAALDRPIIPPELVPRRAVISRQQVLQQLADPEMTPEQRQNTVNNYMAQFQPIQMPVTGGTVLINPQNPMQQKFIPSIEKASTKYPGGYETPTPYVTSPYGNSITRLPMQTPGAPGATPRPPAQPPAGGALPFAPAQGAAPASTLPGGPPPAMPAPPAAPAGLPAGALPFAAAGAPAAPALPAGGPAMAQNAPMVPPTIGGLNAPPPGAPPMGPKVASNINIPGIPQQDQDIMDKFRKIEIDQAQKKSAAEGAGKAFSKRYEDMTVAGNKAVEEAPLLDIAKNLMNDPRNYTGIGADAVLDWNRIKSAAGQALGNEELKNSAAPQETFKKIVSGNILNAMKSQLQGLGQIRVAEIHLLQQANASSNNTIPANRALIEIAKRANDRLVMFNNMAQDYASGSEVVDPLDPKNVLAPANMEDGEIRPRNGIDFGYDKVARKFAQQHPAFTPDETKNYEQLFSGKPGDAGKPAATASQEPTRVSSPDEASKLPPGTRYITPDGRHYTR